MFVPASPFYNNGCCVRELQAVDNPLQTQEVLVRGHAGLVINKHSFVNNNKG